MASIFSPRNQTRRGKSMVSLIFSSLNSRTSKVPWNCSGLLALAFLAGGHRVVADGGFVAAARAMASKVPNLLSFTACSDSRRPCGSVKRILKFGVFRDGVLAVSHIAQDAAHRHGFAGQIGRAVGVEIAFGCEAGGKLEAGERQVEGGGMAGAQGEDPHVAEILERFERGLEHAVVAGLAGGGDGGAIAD